MSSPDGTVSTDNGIPLAFVGACNQLFGICPTAMKVIVMSEAKIVGGHGMSLPCTMDNSVYVGLIAAGCHARPAGALRHRKCLAVAWGTA